MYTQTSFDYYAEVAKGNRQGVSLWNKFGYNLDIDNGVEEIIASFGGTFSVMTTADTLNLVSTSAADNGSGTGARTVQIIGIDENADQQTEIVTLNGLTPVTTTNQWLGINRMIVISAGSGGDATGTISATDTSGSFGTQAQIVAGANVTQQAIFHTPRNHNFLAKWLLLNGRKLSGGGVPRITFKGYSYSRVTGLRYEVFREDIETDVENTIELNPAIPFVIGGREVLYFTASTSVNDTAANCRFSGELHDNA